MGKKRKIDEKILYGIGTKISDSKENIASRNAYDRFFVGFVWVYTVLMTDNGDRFLKIKMTTTGYPLRNSVFVTS